MAISSKMRRVGESTYYTKFLKPKLEQVLEGETYEAEHVVGKKKFIVHTDRVSDEKVNEVNVIIDDAKSTQVTRKSYNHNFEISWREIDKYARCETDSDIKALNPNYKDDVTTDGEWFWNLPNLRYGGYSLFESAFKIKYFRFHAPKCTFVYRLIGGNSPIECDIYLPSWKVSGESALIAGNNKIRKVRLNIGSDSFTLSYLATGCTSLSEFVINDLPKLFDIGNGFSGTQLNKESALRLLNMIPPKKEGYYDQYDWTYKATIGIHIDNQIDEEVLSAITALEEKGWTLTIQWNGTPTEQAASTFALRQPVYARFIERQDTEEDFWEWGYLDWGHYVTKPEDYQQFSSLEEARDYFNIPEEINN